MVDKSFPSPAVVVGGIGQTKVVQNIGAKRVAGHELLTKGKVPQFLYYIVDISSMCCYANDGTDLWIGGFGQPVAGSQVVRDSLQPFEGQKYYVVETDISYEYRGGSWEGGVIGANTLAPTYLEPTEPGQLARGRNYVITTEGEYILPPAASADLGNSINGHAIHISVSINSGATLHSYGEETFSNHISNGESSMELRSAGSYLAIYRQDYWEVFYSETDDYLFKAANLADLPDKALARENLDVDSAEDTSIAIHAAVQSQTFGAGLTKSGNSTEGTLTYTADFATDAEASDPTVDDKVIAPKNIAEAVSAATRSSEFVNITGLLPKSTEAQFLMTVTADRSVLDYPEFSVVFNAEPYMRTEALEVLTVPAGQIVIPDVLGNFTYRAVVSYAGTITLQGTEPLPSSVTEVYLGAIVVIDGEVATNTSGQDIVFNTPWLASSGYDIRNTSLKVNGLAFSASTTVGQLVRSATDLVRESANWSNSTVDPHTRTLPAKDPAQWTYLDRDGNLVGAIGTAEVDGSELDDGSSVVPTRYSIQIGYVGSGGEAAVLLGQEEFQDYVEATAALENYAPIVPDLLEGTLEITRWVVKGDQYPGSGTLDLSIPENFSVQAGSGVQGGSTVPSAADITSSNTDNTLADTNLQLQIDALSRRTSWTFISAGAAFDFLGDVVALNTGEYILPPLPESGVKLKLSAIDAAVADFTVAGGGELIQLASDATVTDTVFRIIAEDSGKIYELVSDGTNWIL